MNINFKSAEICSVLKWDRLTKWQVSYLHLSHSQAPLMFLSFHSAFVTPRCQPLNEDFKKVCLEDATENQKYHHGNSYMSLKSDKF